MTEGQQWYQEYLRSPRWRLIRTIRRARDGRCRTCRNGLPLEVHHASYKRLGKWKPFGLGLIWELLDVITVCETCHERLHRE